MTRLKLTQAAYGSNCSVVQKRGLIGGVSALSLALAMATAAHAQTPPPEDEGVTLEDVVVTGSRVVRDGYQAPTPLTVVNEQELQASAPANVADFVNEIPSVVGSATPATSNASISAGTSGVNSLNLRALGATRTLVLLDGQRSVGSVITGAVDVNTFPQGLIKSVEIVTGGASAAYGSDAVSGVVNFILDKELTGIKGSAEYGQTTYGDDDSYRLNLSAGIPFADGRGKVLLNAELTERDGIFGVPRDWNNNGWYMINNPAYAPGNGQPERLVTSHAGLSNATPGGIIANTPLRGTYFGQGGAVGQFAYGQTRDPWMIGGDWESVQVNDQQSLHADERRSGLFGRVSYELTDSINIFAQGSWNKHASLGWTGVQFNQGNVVIRSDNAFLPASIRQQLAALNINQFNLGTTNADLPIRKTDNERTVERFVVGANGRFDAFDKEFKWDAYYQRGETNTHEVAADITNNARLALAQDAVFHPTSGQIVCRSSIANPSNGCVPFNRMGIGVNSQAALDYILGDPYRKQRFTQDVAAVNLAGDPFSTWAGPVSIATGLEHRREKVSGEVPTEYRSGWFVGNYMPTFGEYNVTEGYVEAVVPLGMGIDLNTAVRGTNYSTSGYVTTWKVGATYSPTPDVRFRATRSRDIRAPNLNELFAAGTSRTNTLIDPSSNNSAVQFTELTTGNLNLKPEIADTWGVGVVVQPSFLPGLGFSIDYYDIEINGAIGSVLAQTIVDRCFEGSAEYCAAITRGTTAGGASVITGVAVSPFNFAKVRARGLDLEASYRFSMSDVVESWPGSMVLRAVGTHYIENYQDNGIDPPIDTAGQNFGDGPPSWLYRMTATYTAEPWTIQLTGRGVSSGTYENAFIECASNCPASTTFNRTVNDNHINGAFYVDASFTYDLGLLNGTQTFFNVTNLTNEDPEIVAHGPAGTAYGNPSTNQGIYDFLGRTFRVGVRFKY
jgi:outer membrane receptor protein involved in Fe transport